MLTETNLGRWHLNIITSSLSLSLWELFIFITNIFTVTFPWGKLPQDFPLLGYQQQHRLHPVGRVSMNEPSSHEETKLDHQPTHQMSHKSVRQLPSYPGWAHSFRLNGSSINDFPIIKRLITDPNILFSGYELSASLGKKIYGLSGLLICLLFRL